MTKCNKYDAVSHDNLLKQQKQLSFPVWTENLKSHSTMTVPLSNSTTAIPHFPHNLNMLAFSKYVSYKHRKKKDFFFLSIMIYTVEYLWFIIVDEEEDRGKSRRVLWKGI